MSDRDQSEGEPVPGVDPAAVDDAFELLASADQRAVLSYLRVHGETDLDELADVVAGRNAAAEGTFVHPERRERAMIDLHHATLPALADRGIVDYDTETGRVAPGEIPTALDELLDLALTASFEIGEGERLDEDCLGGR